METVTEQLAEVVALVVNEASLKMCLHEETHRAGAIWSVCDQCGVKWADDEPKPLPKQPRWYPMATQALARYSVEKEKQRD